MSQSVPIVSARRSSSDQVDPADGPVENSDDALTNTGTAAPVETHIVPLTRPAIASLSDEWRALASAAGQANPFLEPDFVGAALALFPTGGQPRIVTMRQGATLIGLLIVGVADRFARLPMPFLMSFNHRHQFLSSPLVRAGHEDIFADALLDWLDTLNHIRFLRLDKQIGDGPVQLAVKSAADRRGAYYSVIDRKQRPAFVKPDAGAASLSRKRQRTIAAQRKKLEQCGVISIDHVDEADRSATAIEDFLDLEHRSWKGALGTSLLSTSDDLTFFRQAFSALAANGRARFWRMTLDGQTIAATADIICDKTIFGFKCAYDARYRRFGPGLILMQAITEAATDDASLAMIDSCADQGNDSLALLWAGHRPIEDIVIVRRGVLNTIALRIAVMAINARKRFSDHAVGRALARLF